MEPITREEMYLAAAAGYDVDLPSPITRKEVFLAKLAGMEVETPVPFTRRERFLEAAAVAANKAVIEPLAITENGTYNAPEGVDGYNPVTVNVPAPEIKLQDKTITENGEYTADSGFDGLGKVTVEVAGSGGGSLPAGLYFEQDGMLLPNRYGQMFFRYKGYLYLYTWSSNSSSGDQYIYRYENDVWTLMFTFAKFYGMGIEAKAIEFNGKMHFFLGGNYDKTHVVYDDENGPVALNETPSYVYRYACFVHEGKLKAHCYTTGEDNLYTWDEETDSWTIEANFGATTSMPRAFTVYEDNVYCLSGKEVYSYSQGVLTYLYAFSDTSVSPYGKICEFIGKYAYLEDNCILYKLDITTGNVAKVGALIRYATGTGRARVYYTEGLGLRLHGCDYSAPNTFFNAILHEVTE